MRRSFVVHRTGLAALFAVSVGCSGEAVGDPPSKPSPDPFGRGDRISEIVGPAEWLDPGNVDSVGCASPPNRHVAVTGVTIGAIDRFDETGDGARGNFYVQDTADDPPPHSGMTVFDPSFTPPDLRLAAGDVVDVTGVLIEFLGPTSGAFGGCKTLPEIGGTMSFRFDGAPPVPKTIAVTDLKSYETARQWLGMVVRIENVRLATSGSGNGGRFGAQIDVGGGIEQRDVPAISNELYDIESAGPELTEGATFKSITGVVTYFYGFKLAPRSEQDFEP